MSILLHGSTDVSGPSPETFYRFDTVRYSLGLDQFDEPLPGSRLEVRCSEFPVIKRTPKGAWIDDYGTRRFILLTAHKQWACETKALAAESFRARKRRQIKILAGQLAEAQEALHLIDVIDPLGARLRDQGGFS